MPNYKIPNSSIKYNTQDQNNLGLTQQYNRKLYEGSYGTKRKKEFKEKQFGNNKVIFDPISEEILHKSQKAAMNKYGKKQWSIHSAETDHISAIKNVYSHAKNNPFITEQQFKEIINADENFRIISKSMNTSKQDSSDYKTAVMRKKKNQNDINNHKSYYQNNDLSVKGTTTLLKQKVKSDLYLHKELGKTTLNNISSEAKNGAVNALYDNVIPLTNKAVDHLCQAALGEISLNRAIKNISKDTIDVAVIGAAKRISDDLIKFQIKKHGNSFLQKLSESNELTQIIQVSLIVKDAAIKYINGEITSQEFIDYVGKNGIKMVVGLIGAQIGKEAGTIIGGWIGTITLPGIGTIAGATVGRVVGEVLGAIISTIACSAIMAYTQTIKHLNSYKKHEKYILKLERDIIYEMKKQRDIFENIVKNEFHVWDENIAHGFNLMMQFSCQETFNFQKVNKGLDMVLSVFDIETQYKNSDDFKNTFHKKIKLNI